MAIGTIASVVTAVAAAASAYVGYTSAQAAKSAAKKKEALEQQRLAIQQRQAELETSRAQAKLRREARAKRASLANTAAAANVLYTSTYTGAETAIGSNESRENQYAETTLGNTTEANSITGEQISIASDLAVSQANADAAGAIIGGVKGIATIAAENAGSIEGLFGDTTTPSDGVDTQSGTI